MDTESFNKHINYKMIKMKQIILVLVMSSCLSLGYARSWLNKKVSGNGNVTTKNISTESYDVIELIGFMDVHLKKGKEGLITVAAEENLHEYIVVEVKKNKLVLKTTNHVNIKTKKGIHITVPFEDISKVTLTGSGDIDTKDEITANKFYVSVIGSGDIILDVKASKVKAIVTGSGDMTLSGSTSSLEVDVLGSGNFGGFSMTAQNTKVLVSGSGDAKVVAKEKLVAKVAGSGDILYKGNPSKREIKTFGSGSISSR